MREEINLQGDYHNWITEVKSKIRSTQMKAVIAVNTALIHFYWELGRMIAEKIESSHWGDKILEQVSADLKAEFPDMKGLSRSNLAYTKQFYLFYNTQIVQQGFGQLEKSDGGFVQQLVGQIPWGHNILIFTKSKNKKEAEFYLSKTIENGWSRDTLAFQIKSNLYERQGKAVNNFKNTLPELRSDLAEQTLKDPYIFDFLTLSESFKERDIENQLVNHIRKFLLELGKGFAFALRDINKPMGVSEFELTTTLPNDLKSSLPTIEELERNLLENN